MDTQVLIEPLRDRPGYRTRLGEPFDLVVEAATEEESLRLLAILVQERLQAGARVVPFRISRAWPAPSRRGVGCRTTS